MQGQLRDTVKPCPVLSFGASVARFGLWFLLVFLTRNLLLHLWCFRWRGAVYELVRLLYSVRIPLGIETF